MWSPLVRHTRSMRTPDQCRRRLRRCTLVPVQSRASSTKRGPKSMTTCQRLYAPKLICTKCPLCNAQGTGWQCCMHRVVPWPCVSAEKCLRTVPDTSTLCLCIGLCVLCPTLLRSVPLFCALCSLFLCPPAHPISLMLSPLCCLLSYRLLHCDFAYDSSCPVPSAPDPWWDRQTRHRVESRGQRS